MAATPFAASPARGRVTARSTAGLRALALLLLIAVISFAAPAAAREAIQSFTSNIILKTDGTVDVIETIEVNAENDQINHGIYRDIFTVLTNPDNSRLRSSLNVIAVTRDGYPEPFSVEGLGSNAKRIKIGSGDVWLDRRTYRYAIHYTMSRMGRSFDDHDEIFWNVTGNYWSFPILKATATVQLPQGATVQDTVGYTGGVGSLEKAVTITPSSSNSVTVRANRVLQPGEGMSVAVAFQKGILVEPQGLQKLGYWLSDHRDLVLPSIAVFIVLLYNLLAWGAVGRDPAKGTIIPLFHAPKDFSPGLVHYINQMGWKQNGWTAFTASIFSLGVKGLVTVDKEGKSLRVKSTGRGDAHLPPGEAGLFGYFRSKGTVTVNKENGAKLNEKRGELVSTIEKENRQVYFKNNYGYVLLGFALSVVCLGTLVLTEVLEPVYLIVALFGGVFIGLFTNLFNRLWAGNIMSKIIIFIWIVVGGGNLLGGLSGFATSIRIDNGLIAAVSIVVINVVFGVLMRAPTVQGRKIMDQIDGFKMYLNTAEKNRLNFVGEPQMTVVRFESILPFAIALGVEKPWSERFAGELARNAVPDAANGSYSPVWYRGSDWSSSSSGFSNSVAAISTGMSAAMISAQPTSSSSSGFSGGGGGGGSGGGGGGGGGGGW